MEGEVDMRDDVANRMSLFYAHPTPLLNALSATTKRFVEMVSVCMCVRACRRYGMNYSYSVATNCVHSTLQHSELPLENTTDCLSMVACVCRVMTENP